MKNIKKILWLAALLSGSVIILGVQKSLNALAEDETILFQNSGQSLGSSPSYGIDLGDLDGDGDLDAFVAQTGPNSVWFNNGQGFFQDSSQRLGVASSTDVALGDLDGDGDLDAFVGNRGSFFGSPDEVWLNDGDGRFQITDQSLGELSTEGVAIGDVDHDGDLDVFSASCGPGFPSTDENKLWINNGNGHFSDSGQDFGMPCSTDAVLIDVNADDHLDLIVADAGSPNPPTSSFGIEIWLNDPDGTGSFTKTQVLDRTYNFGIDLGDVDGDQDADIFIANGDALGGVKPNTVWLNDGTGTFSDSGQLLGSKSSNEVELGDVDGDGDLDAFVVNSSYQAGQPDEVWLNEVWLNDGSGHFIDSGGYLGNEESLDVSLGDLDNDGDLDAFVATSGPDQVWFNMTLSMTKLFFPFIPINSSKTNS